MLSSVGFRLGISSAIKLMPSEAGRSVATPIHRNGISQASASSDRQQEAELWRDLVAGGERGVLGEGVDQLHAPPSRFAMVRNESAVRAIRAASVSSVAAEALPMS